MGRTNGTAVVAPVRTVTMRAVIALGVLVASAIGGGCAALESWDQFSSEPRADAGPDSASDASADQSVVDVNEPKPITFVQGTSTSHDNVELGTVNVLMNDPQIAGDLNVVVVGWYGVNQTVTSVVDTAGNTYRLAVGPTSQISDTVMQSIYYASGIAAEPASANTITVTFDAQTDSPDVRVLEYSGLDTKDPFDTSAASSGVSTTAASGALTTHFAPALLVVGATSESGFSVAGSGYTLRVLSDETNLAADQIVTAIGSYSADAPTTPSRGWVMQLASFH
jgi:hypothetical protein